MQFTPEDRAKLTKKSLRYLEYVENELRIALRQKKEYEDLFHGAKSDTSFTTDFSTDVYIPDDACVTLTLLDTVFNMEGTEVPVKTRVRLSKSSDAAIMVNADRGLSIELSSSNTFKVKLQEF